MITLKTLPQATEQEVFSQVATHLLTQNERSILHDRTTLLGDSASCMYRAGALKCAAGCLIGDDEYKIEMEETTWDMLVIRRVVPKDHACLIGELQSIHDSFPACDWIKELEILAESRGLKL